MPLLSEPQLKGLVPLRKSLVESARDLQRGAIKSWESEESFDVFLSHSYRDAKTIEGLKIFLEGYGLSVFVDWIEAPLLDRSRVTPDTAQFLREAMDRSSSLLYAASANAQGSKWMPWELGYSDARHGRVAVAPIAEQETESESYSGQEYLGLYPYITETPDQNQRNQPWINHSPCSYVGLPSWLRGLNPKLRTQ